MAKAPMPSWMELWNEWEIQTVVVASFSLQVILFFFAGIRRYNVSSVLKVLLWLVYLLADLAATYALGHMSSSLSQKSSGEHQLVAFWAPFLLLHLGGQDTITAYALEDNELWRRHLLNMVVQVAGTAYVLYKYMNAGEATFLRAAMLVLAAGVVKYSERIWALKDATKKEGSQEIPLISFIRCICCSNHVLKETAWWQIKARDCFTKNKQFETNASIVMAAHSLCDVLVKPLIIERNEAAISWRSREMELLTGHAQGYPWEDDKSQVASAEEMRQIGNVYKAIEVELALMYDMLYTKAQVIHTWYGYCTRAVSLVSCFSALAVFRTSKRDGYSTPDTVITFALLCGACALEVTSVFKAIGSTWTYAILRGHEWNWLANAILFARYHLAIVKDGRWSNSVGQFNFIFFPDHSKKDHRKRATARLFGFKHLWDKAHYTKHAKLSPSVKEFVWELLKGDKSDMVQIEDAAIRTGYWARRLRGFDHSEQLDWSLSSEFQKSVLIWHIATSTFLNRVQLQSELVDKDMAEAVRTLSDYMMYLLVKHPDILPVKADDRKLFDEACGCYSFDLTYPFFRSNADEYNQMILDYKDGRVSDRAGKAALVEASSLAHQMLGLKLGVTHRMVIIGRVWTEMLCYAATNATGEFHARQLSNGGEFLTHILLLTKYSAAITEAAASRAEKHFSTADVKSFLESLEERKAADETVEGGVGHVELTVDDGGNDEITEIR